MRARITHLPCGAEGCGRGQHARGYCQKHYQWRRRHGKLLPIREIGIGTQAKPQGVTCQICGRSVMDHGVSEFCQLMMREAL